MKNRLLGSVLLCSVLAFPLLVSTQTQTAPSAPAQTPAPQAAPADVDSVEHLVAALYDVISGPAGPRNWERFRSLCYPGARFIPSGIRDGKIGARAFTTDEYAERAKPIFEKEGFFENSIANRIEIWDHIAHVWSTYESRHAKGEKPFARGINSIQLLNDGSRWWVVTVYWESEDAAHPLPDKYLH